MRMDRRNGSSIRRKAVPEAPGHVQRSLQTLESADHQRTKRKKRDLLYKTAAPSPMLPARQLLQPLSPGTELGVGSPPSPFPGVQNLEGERNLTQRSLPL